MGMYQLSKLDAKGLKVKKDEQKALHLLQQAADSGFRFAMFDLALCYGRGDLGVDIDEKKERELFERAAAAGYIIAF